MSGKVWRGQMPFRLNRKLRLESYKNQERTGESFLATYRRIMEVKSRSYGKAEGSYTEQMRDELRAWLKARNTTQVTFTYKESRHKRVVVVLGYPTIRHTPVWGNGKAGFVLEGIVISYDGMSVMRGKAYQRFSFNRIEGHGQSLPMLTSGG